MTLKKLVSDFRKDHNLSQRKFADMCGLSNGFISMLERGYNPSTKEPIVPGLPTLKKLANGMGMSLQDFFSIVDDMPVSLEKPDFEECTDEELFSKSEVDLIHAYRKAPPDKRLIVDLTLKEYIKTPTPVSRDGLEDSADSLMGYVGDMDPGQQKSFRDQMHKLIEPQKESLASAAPASTDNKSPESEPPDRS